MIEREVRAFYDAEKVTVYQAYSPEIAGPAMAAGTFVPPFSPGRMTWIKPSFLWMMHRSGWGTKPGQERVLAIDITHDGLLWALAHSCLSSYDQDVYGDRDQWREVLGTSPVRIQWDPERDVRLNPRAERAVQIGLGGEASHRYVREWIVGITDVSSLVQEVRELVRTGEVEQAIRRLPAERPYSLTPDVARRIGSR